MAAATLETASAAVLQPRRLPDPVPHEWHWPEYGAELAGTAWNVFVGLSAVVFNFAPGLPGARLIPDASLRLWVTGLIFAGSGSLFTISPWGRLSGAHINPSVTLAFWAHGKLRWHDGVGYLVAQFLGGSAGALGLRLVWSGYAADVRNGLTLPGPGYTVWAAFVAEFVMTFAYLLAVFFFVSRAWLARWTPLMNWIVVAGLVWLGAGVSGTSLNPARSFGPALVSADWCDQWIYFLGPPLGGVSAALAAPWLSRGRVALTAKLFHSNLYRSIFKNCALHPHA